MFIYIDIWLVCSDRTLSDFYCKNANAVHETWFKKRIENKIEFLCFDLTIKTKMTI